MGLTVMKGFAGGRLFDAKRSPFGVALTPVQCIHYALTRPAVASILAGYDTPEHVDEAVSYSSAKYVFMSSDAGSRSKAGLMLNSIISTIPSSTAFFATLGLWVLRPI